MQLTGKATAHDEKKKKCIRYMHSTGARMHAEIQPIRSAGWLADRAHLTIALAPRARSFPVLLLSGYHESLAVLWR